MNPDRALRWIRHIALNGMWRETADEYHWKRSLQVITRILSAIQPDERRAAEQAVIAAVREEIHATIWTGEGIIGVEASEGMPKTEAALLALDALDGEGEGSEKGETMQPYVDENKVYHNGEITYSLWDLTWDQINGVNQVPAVAGAEPDNSHWEKIGRSADRINAEHDEYYRTGRTATHGETTGEGV